MAGFKDGEGLGAKEQVASGGHHEPERISPECSE